MSDLIFENIGGHELINIARNDTINGQTISYQPIKNLTSIQQQYNPNNVVALQNTSDKYFANFSIKLETKLPEEGAGPDAAYVYIEDSTGDLIIELINLEPDEQIEVQISLSGTIYEAEFNES
jgi:alpha-L-arabinofuranosidase